MISLKNLYDLSHDYFVIFSFPKSELAKWNADDILREVFGVVDERNGYPLQLLHVCSERRTYATGHVLERDMVTFVRR